MPVMHGNTPTWQPKSPDSHMLSFTFTLTWDKATGTESCAGRHPTASLQYQGILEGPRRVMINLLGLGIYGFRALGEEFDDDEPKG